jgi:hypothetical protein
LAAVAATALVCFGLLGLLAVPVDLRFAVGPTARPRLELAWAFGLWRGELQGRRGSVRRRSRGRWSEAAAWARAWREGLGERLPRLLRSLRRGVRVRELRLRARVGLGDPADTGLLVGWAAPLLAMARAAPRLDLHLEPDFAREILEGEARGELRAFPLLVLPPLLRFALSSSTVRGVRALRSRR